MPLIREFSEKAIKALKQEPLFNGHLFADIVAGNPKGPRFVFPAVRNGRIDFYWGGGKLFSYEQPSGFKTHHKYASVLFGNSGDDYISESLLGNGTIRLIKDFCEGYERIKENCEKYSGSEALGVSSLYERFSCARKGAPSVVVLDIEASFANNEGQGQDRVDIVTLDTDSNTIRFVEAKHYSNHASLKTSSEVPAVFDQMQKYAAQIQNPENKILEAYKKHVNVINALFSIDIPEPAYVDPEPILLIFGFDKEQRDHYLKPKIEKPLRDKGLRIYSIGEIKESNLSVVFRGGKANW